MKRATTQPTRMMACSMHRLWPGEFWSSGVAASAKTLSQSLRPFGRPLTAAAHCTDDTASFLALQFGHEPCQPFCERRGADLVRWTAI